jgi:hypothetical protein
MRSPTLEPMVETKTSRPLFTARRETGLTPFQAAGLGVAQAAALFPAFPGMGQRSPRCGRWGSRGRTRTRSRGGVEGRSCWARRA